MSSVARVDRTFTHRRDFISDLPPRARVCVCAYVYVCMSLYRDMANAMQHAFIYIMHTTTPA